MTKTEKFYKCERCTDGQVAAVISETKFSKEVKVKKCSSCKFQYGIKGISRLSEIQPQTT